MLGIKNYEVTTSQLNELGSWSYEGIIGMEYMVNLDDWDSFHTTLELTFLVELIKSSQRFKLKLKYYNVFNLTIKGATNIPLTNSLIIHDKKEEGWESSQRYHVHDDSGYGENDGFNCINFYCSSIEAISLEDFYL
ncbi:hypothetical protein AB4Z30_28880 [Paenibacillus sp. 2TAF8]|uniref:hypothetical protein n=1 Tax=Paenibacillus sp. 2TAF8 TaxID=3233020 RepID=UPI003F9767AC